MNRTKKSARNTFVGLICNIVSMFLSFLLRAVFIRLLGLEYSGINSLFSSILNILNLVDLGFSNAILFKLYKTIADDDKEKTEMYMATYKKICYAIGIIVGVLGLCCLPFLNNFISEVPSFSEPLWSLYIITLATCVANHFVSYRNILLIAMQDRYVATIIKYLCAYIKLGLQIFVLAFFKNIYLYLSAELLSVLLQGIIVGVLSGKKYHLSWHSKNRLSKEESRDITKDVGTLAIFKLCRTVNATVDTFLISKFINVSQTAVYASVTVVTSALDNLLSTLNDGIIASVGDINARGEKEHLEQTFRMSMHIMYLLYGVCSAVMAPFLSSFCNWWIGYTLPNSCIYLILFNFFIDGMNGMVSTYRNAMGLYRKGWKRPAITTIINLSVSIILIQKIGILGALIGTAVSNIFTMVWYDPYIVYCYGFRKSSKQFFARYFAYISFVLLTSVCTIFVGQCLPNINGFFSLVWQGLVFLLVSIILLLFLGAFIRIQKSVLIKFSEIIKPIILK